MNDSFLFNCAVSLCSSDHISGYVSPNPVIDTRDKITEQRLTHLYKLVKQVKENVEQLNDLGNKEIIKYCFKRAIELTSSDIACGVIAEEPILYDRDEKIAEVIIFYFGMVNKLITNLKIELQAVTEVSSTIVENIQQVSEPAVEYKTVVIPVYQKMKKSKIKKGKR